MILWPETNRKNSGKAQERPLVIIPSRASGGPLEGVETRRLGGIASNNTPPASGTEAHAVKR